MCVIAGVFDLAGPAVEGLKAVSYTVPPLTDTPAVREYRAALASLNRASAFWQMVPTHELQS